MKKEKEKGTEEKMKKEKEKRAYSCLKNNYMPFIGK